MSQHNQNDDQEPLIDKLPRLLFLAIAAVMAAKAVEFAFFEQLVGEALLTSITGWFAWVMWAVLYQIDRGGLLQGVGS